MSKRLSQRRGSTSIRFFSKIDSSQFGDFPYPGLLKKTYTSEEQHSLKFINSTLLTETALDLTDKNLTIIPEEIKLLQNLEQLTLSSNKISKLPNVIGSLSNLQVFFFSHNSKYLILSENFLTELPPEIGDLKNLDMLLVNHNRLESIPPEIGNLTKLGCLYLQGNSLKTIPKEISKLTQLTTLNLKVILEFN
jgi:leucine-rich repeat protein SHOC2